MSDALKKAHEARERLREAGIPIVQRNPLEKFAEKPTPMNAIRVFCFQCHGGKDADSGYKAAIRNCTAPSCALYRYRPYR